MSRIIAIIFLSLHLLTNTELCQLVKIPVLLSHFKEHKAENNHLTLLGFLQMHYFNGNPHDNTDMELPFKTTTVALIIHNCPSAPVPSITAVPSSPTQELQLNFNEYYSNYLPSVCNKDIFQPPQLS